GVVLVASSAATLKKAGVEFVPAALIGVAATFFGVISLAILAGKLANPWTAPTGEVSTAGRAAVAGIPEIEFGIDPPVEPAFGGGHNERRLQPDAVELSR
ncbi:MAG: hypothetical protein WAP37_01850, partial [Solirubrobacterales bacterium]